MKLASSTLFARTLSAQPSRQITLRRIGWLSFWLFFAKGLVWLITAWYVVEALR